MNTFNSKFKHTDCLRLLQFIWRWKVVTTSIVWKHFFSHTKKESCYRYLKRLQKSGYIKIESLGYNLPRYWTLTPNGYKKILPFLPELVAKGYFSEIPYHDLIVTAIQTPGKEFHDSYQIEVCTEQELFRFCSTQLPDWLPTYLPHRSDGYWCVHSHGMSTTTALEVELSAKREADYYSIFEFYSEANTIDQVIWVTADKKLAKRIKKYIPSNSIDKHVFFLLEHMQELGWNTPSISSQNNPKFFRDYILQTQSEDLPEPDTLWRWDMRLT